MDALIVAWISACPFLYDNVLMNALIEACIRVYPFLCEVAWVGYSHCSMYISKCQFLCEIAWDEFSHYLHVLKSIRLDVKSFWMDAHTYIVYAFVSWNTYHQFTYHQFRYWHNFLLIAGACNAGTAPISRYPCSFPWSVSPAVSVLSHPIPLFPLPNQPHAC